MKIYLVGGAVRDSLLGIPVDERDWVVVGSNEAEMLAQGFRRADAAFPVFLHPETGEEYALARTERKQGSGYKGFEVDAGQDVTLEQDLKRRDLTINAMAQDLDGNIIDPFNGLDDLRQGLLRHVSPAFVEDPLRLLRTARFAARFDFILDPETQVLLEQIAASGELATLKRERVWKELDKALSGKAPWRFFELLQHSGALSQLLPQITNTTDAEKSLKRAAALSSDPIVRFAAVMYNVTATGGGAKALEQVLPLPGEYAWLLDMLVRYADQLPLVAAGEPEGILNLIIGLRAEQKPERFSRFQQAASAIWPELMQQLVQNMQQALVAISKVSVTEVQDDGFSGNDLGVELNRRRLEAIADSLQG